MFIGDVFQNFLIDRIPLTFVLLFRFCCSARADLFRLYISAQRGFNAQIKPRTEARGLSL